MSDSSPCPACGTKLRGFGLGGLCHRCVGRTVLLPDEELIDWKDEEADGHRSSDHPEATEDPSNEPQHEIVAGRYRLLELIGEGGFGEVYAAEQTEPVQRQVALKILKLGMDTKQVVSRFEGERQALALMDHPYIATVHDAGVTALGRPFFVMELVCGLKITDFCARHRLSVADRIELFIKVCQAVQHAHQKGIIHRDIKPSNIIVAMKEGVPDPKIIDFGIAKATQIELTKQTVLTQLHHFLGTPAYMSPEQLEMSGVDVDTRSDIYSLGVLLYELITGSTPFDTTHLSYEQICRHIRENDPPKPSTRLKTLSARKPASTPCLSSVDRVGWRKEIRRDLDQIVMKALEKDRTHRYATANALALDLSRYLNDEPVLAASPSSIYRFGKLVRRHRGIFAAVSILAVTLVFGAVLSTWQAIRATRSEREQARLRLEAQAQAYAADMNLAQQAYTVHNLGRMRDLLNRHRPPNSANPSAAPDFRGWEWRYLWNQSQGSTRDTLCQMSNGVFSLSISHDGQWVAIGERLGGLSVWDVPTKTKIATLWDRAVFIRVAFSPKTRLLAYSTMGSGASSVYLWDGAVRKVVAERPLNGGCSGLSFSPDGSMLMIFTHAASNQISILGIPEGTLLASYSLPGIETDWNGNLNITAEDFTLAAHRAYRNHARVFDTATGVERLMLPVSELLVMALAFSPDTKLLAAGTGLDEGVIYVWNVETGQQIARWEAHRGYIMRLRFWPDGKTLASAGADQSIGLWDLSDLPNIPAPRRLAGHRRVVLDLALMPDATTLASGSEDGSVMLWDTSRNASSPSQMIITNPVVGWKFGHDGNSILTADSQGKVIQWQGADFHDQKVMLDTESETGSAIFSKDLSRVALASNQGQLQIWDWEAGHLVKGYPAVTSQLSPRGFLSGGERLMVYDHQESRVKELQLPGGQEIKSWPSASWRAAGLVSPNEQWVIRFRDSSQILLTDRVTGQDIALEPLMPAVEGAAFSADGRLVSACSWRGYARVWETESGRLVATFEGFLMGVHSVAFSLDGKRLATTSTGEEAVKLWDMGSLQELLTLPAQNPTFISTRFSPNGNILGAMDYKAKLHLWRAPSGAEAESFVP